MSFWRSVDWQRPWLAPYRETGAAVCRALEQGRSVAQVLDLLSPQGPRFVAAAELPAGQAYEAFIARTGRVPTRDNLHDLFNGLVWLRHPELKHQLNLLQAEQIAAAGVNPTRGALRDAATLFDENAALWQAPPVLVDALRERDWRTLFITRRDAWRSAPLMLFGHALMEKLVHPRKAITAHVWVLPAAGHTTGWLAPQLAARGAHSALPVLGVPGWWLDNEDEAFYDDAGVFRPARG